MQWWLMGARSYSQLAWMHLRSLRDFVTRRAIFLGCIRSLNRVSSLQNLKLGTCDFGLETLNLKPPLRATHEHNPLDPSNSTWPTFHICRWQQIGNVR